MTHGYDEIYLDDAMETLGNALEYAVLSEKLDGQEFLDLFLASGLADEFGRGNVKYISGMSGIEFCGYVLESCGMTSFIEAELPHTHYPSEYWAGWILAYYQWYTGKSFTTICNKIRYKDLDRLYHVLHEADPSKSVTVFDKIMQQKTETNLAKFRKCKGLSQSELARNSGVSIRSIQLYEQRRNNINHAQHNHLRSLAMVLGCEISDLLE